MVVFRITLARYAGKLTSSGNAARWNSRDVHVIYTSGSRALACLENVVHRSSTGLQNNFRTILVEIPDNLKISVVDKGSLIPTWKNLASITYTRAIGDKWIKESSSVVLRVPSVLVPEEFNYLLNPSHKDFKKIKYLGNEPFEFDARIKT